MNGIFNVLKPSGMSSSYAVVQIKRLTGEKCGHMGTLDPGAAGVLLVGAGRGARLFDYLLHGSKSYRAVFLFGVETDTLDTLGRVTATCDKPVSAAEIAAKLAEFTGEITQLPPKYSALNVGGSKAYKLAREGQDFEIKPRAATVHSFDYRRQTGERSFEFDIECASGTYIRSLARDLGASLGTCGVMQSLIRLSCGAHTLKEAHTLDELAAAKEEGKLASLLIPNSEALAFLPRADIPEGHGVRVGNGLSCPVKLADGRYAAYDDGAFLGVAEVAGGTLKLSARLD